MATHSETPPDWWENVPRHLWAERYTKEQAALVARTPRFIAVFLDNEAANYSKRFIQARRIAWDED